MLNFTNSQSAYLSLCYHYIRDTNSEKLFPKILGTPVNIFEEHIEMLLNNFELITPENALNFSYTDYKIQENKIGLLITFDDGLSDHYIAAKILAKLETPKENAKSDTGQITIDEFMKVDLRTGKVLEAEKVKKSKKLIQLKVDIGSETRQILAGIAESFEPEDLIGRTVIIVANLKPAKLMGIESQGMVLAANNDGSLLLAGFDQEPGLGIQVR